VNRAWPEGSPRVLVSDCWLTNAGDAAIAIATQRLIQELAPGAAVLHATYQGNVLNDRYPELEFVPPLATLLEVEFAEPPSPEWGGARGLRLVEGADLVVSQGGGFLMEHYQPWERLFALARVVEMGKPLALVGQGIGAFRLARSRRLMRAIVRGALVVAVRDQQSLLNVIDLGADADHVVLTSDLAWLLVEPPTASSTSGEGIGLLVTKEQSPGDDAQRQALANQVLADVVASSGGETVTIASTVQGLGPAGLEDDSSTAHAAIAALPGSPASDVTVVEGYLTPDQVISTFGSCRAVVTQRFHPAVFALGRGVPAALLLGGDKAGVLDGVGLDRMVCRHPEDPAARKGAIDYVLGANAPRGATLVEQLRPVLDRAAQNRDVLRAALAEVASVPRP
jgi:polysaccharide pyruvyl transferase WcaK-like protein